jgi:hypothetical protein
LICKFLDRDAFEEWTPSPKVRIKLIAPGFPDRVLATVDWVEREKVKKGKLKPASADLGAGETTTLKLKLKKKTLKNADKALDKGTKVQAKVTVEATDAVSNFATANRTIRLK